MGLSSVVTHKYKGGERVMYKGHELHRDWNIYTLTQDLNMCKERRYAPYKCWQDLDGMLCRNFQETLFQILRTNHHGAELLSEKAYRRIAED